MFSLFRHSRLTKPRSRLLINRLMMTFTPRKMIYCLHSWRLTIRYLPLQLLRPRRKFLLADALAFHPARLPQRNLCRSTRRLLLCALVRAHTLKCPLTRLPPNSAFLYHRSRSSRCLFLTGGRGWILMTQLMKELQLTVERTTKRKLFTFWRYL